jgi:hypothetical protein
MADQFMAKAFVVTHLPSITKRPSRPQQHARFHIVHTGNLNPPGHSSEALMRGLRLFLDRTPQARGRVRLTQAGWFNGDVPECTKRFGLEHVVDVIGRVSQDEVSELLDSANLLVGFDYSRPHSATLLSKLPDYVNARRPILVLTAPTSAMGQLFAEDRVGLTAHYDSAEEVAERVGRVFDAWCQHKTDTFLPQTAAIESFSDDSVLAELGGAFAVARRAGRVRTEEARGLALLGEEPSR